MRNLMLVLFALTSTIASSQDVIFTKQGDTINCKLKKIEPDSMFYAIKGENTIKTIVSSEVQFYRLDYYAIMKQQEDQEKKCFMKKVKTDYPDGIYMTLAELQDKKPSRPYNLRIVKRTDGNITSFGGNRFKFVSPNASISKREIKRKVFAIAKNGYLYINCLPHRAQKWYARVHKVTDTSLVFEAVMTNKEYAKKSSGYMLFGLAGAAAAAAHIKLAKSPRIYELMLESGSVKKLESNM